MSKEPDIFNNNGADISAMIAKGTVGAIPLVGSMVGEIVGNLIPNQRIDRIAQYVEMLNSKFDNLSKDTISKLLHNELFIDLIEESLIKASRALSNERRIYLANIVERGMSNDDIDISSSKHVLNIISELNDSEIIWLCYFNERAPSDKNKFKLKHSSVLADKFVVLSSSLDDRRSAAINDSYRDHLERIKLIKHHIKMDENLNVPEYDKLSNQPRISYSTSTVLGKMVLEFIGLIEKILD